MTPWQYSVMEAVLVMFYILNLTIYQLQKITPASHSAVVPQLIMLWAQVCSLMDQIQEVNQIWHHPLPILNDGNSSSEDLYAQSLHIAITKNNSGVLLPSNMFLGLLRVDFHKSFVLLIWLCCCCFLINCFRHLAPGPVPMDLWSWKGEKKRSY